MRTLLTGRNITVSAGLKQVVARQLTKLDRVLGDAIVSAQVVVSGERHVNVTDITLHMRGDHVFTGTGQATTWPMSVKAAVEHVAQQAQRVKGKWTTRKRRAEGRRAAGPPPGELAEPTASADDGHAPRVYRARTQPKSLTIDAAAERLVNSGEPFLVFRNVDTGRVAVVHRRADGHVALTEPAS